MADKSDGTRFLGWFLTLVVAFSLFRYLHGLAKLVAEAPFIDFAHYYSYTTVVALGLDPFDLEAVRRVDAMLHLRRAGSAANYPPLFYVLMRPWILLPFRSAALAWLLACQGCLLATFGFCLRRFASPTPVRVAAALFVLLNYQPLIESLALGQANVPLLSLVTLAWWGLRAGHPWVAATAVAMALHVKPQYGLLLPFLWWAGHRRVLARALLLAAFGLAVSLVSLGPAQHIAYLRYVGSPPEYLHAWTANLSPRATLHRLFAGDRSGPLLANGLTLALDAALLLLFARAVRRSPAQDPFALDWGWSLGLTAIPLISPLTEEHHMVVLLLPITVLLLAEPAPPAPRAERAVLLGSILLVASRYSFEQFPAFHQGGLALLAAWKIVGVAGLAWVLIRRLRHAGSR